MKKSLKDVIKEMICENHSKIKCDWKKRIEEEEKLCKEYNLPFEKTDYHKIGCVDCQGYNFYCALYKSRGF